MWEFLEYLKKEGSVVKNAPLAFVASIIIGFSAGQYLRSEQIADRDGKISLRDDQIAALQKQINAALSAAENGQTDKSEAPSIKPEFLPMPRSTPDPNDDIVETSIQGSLSAKQLASLEIALKASPSSVEIQKGGETPKLLANQIQGVFNTSGWKVKVIETADTEDWLLISAPDRASGKTISEAFKSSKVGFRSFEKSEGAITFHLDTRP